MMLTEPSLFCFCSRRWRSFWHSVNASGCHCFSQTPLHWRCYPKMLCVNMTGWCVSHTAVSCALAGQWCPLPWMPSCGNMMWVLCSVFSSETFDNIVNFFSKFCQSNFLSAAGQKGFEVLEIRGQDPRLASLDTLSGEEIPLHLLFRLHSYIIQVGESKSTSTNLRSATHRAT